MIKESLQKAFVGEEWGYRALAVAGAWMLPLRELMIAIGFLVVADTIFGIWRAKKLGEKITSNAFRRVIPKTIAYQSAIILSHIMDLYFIPGDFVVKTVASLIAIAEFKSVMESLGSITGLDLWKTVIQKIHDGQNKSKTEESKKSETSSAISETKQDSELK